jgi:hypothetical protein
MLRRPKCSKFEVVAPKEEEDMRICNLSLPQEIHVVFCFRIEHTLAQPRRNDGS